MPRDLGGTRYSSIHAEAYRRLRPARGLPDADIRIVDTTQGLAGIHDDILERFGADVGLVATGSPSTYRRELIDDGEVERFASVHDIQAQVPPETILAMWQALEEVGDYG